MLSRVSVVLLAVASLACGGGASRVSPSAPTPTVAVVPSRVLSISGALAFGDVVVGSSQQLAFTMGNSGNSTLTIARLSPFGLTDDVTASWTGGTIAAGSTQTVVVTFAPTSPGVIAGGFLAIGDQTGSGSSSVTVTGAGLPFVAGAWYGGHAIRECNGTGSAQDLLCSPQRGVNRIGEVYEFGAVLVQTGAAVAGTVNVGGITGAVSGTVTAGGLTLRGTATSAAGYTLVITDWRTTANRGAMTGTFGYDLTFRGLNGAAAVVSTLESVIRR